MRDPKLAHILVNNGAMQTFPVTSNLTDLALGLNDHKKALTVGNLYSTF